MLLSVPHKRYGRYRILASKLASGEVVMVNINNEKEASKLRAAMRRLYPVVSGLGTPSHPPHKIESSENPKTRAMCNREGSNLQRFSCAQDRVQVSIGTLRSH
jgi:hypothetical protein